MKKGTKLGDTIPPAFIYVCPLASTQTSQVQPVPIDPKAMNQIIGQPMPMDQKTMNEIMGQLQPYTIKTSTNEREIIE